MVRLCWDSKVITAPLVIWLAVPTVHWPTSAAGSLPFQLNEPSWASAASWGAVRGPEGAKLTGR